MGEFRMPSLGADMDAGTLVAWNFKPGDAVKRGDIIGEVLTDKGDIDIEVFEDGIVDQILVPVGQKVPVGTVLAIIRGEGEPAVVAPVVVEAAEIAATVPAGGGDGHAAEPAPPVPVEPAAPSPVEVAPAEHHVRASPLAKRIAAEQGIDLATLKGTGPQGAIERADVEKAIEARKAVPPAPPVVPPPRVAPPLVVPPVAPPPPVELKAPPVEKPAAPTFQEGMRRAIAAAMARSNREIPHYYLESRIDMSKPLKWLEAENLKRPVKSRLLSVVLLIKAVAKALQDIPELNGFWVDDHLEAQEAIHIAFAIALRQGGLITPAIHNADMKSLDELMESMSDLIMRTRAGKLRSSELTDGTITLTNLGDLGVELVHGVIYPPQVALVGFGRMIEQPWVENGMIGIRPIVRASLAGDHRATDGRRGAQFLEALNKHLQDPEKL